MQNLWGSPIADTFCPHPPPIGIPPLACGLGDSTLRRKIPHVHLVPLNVGYNRKEVNICVNIQNIIQQEFQRYAEQSSQFILYTPSADFSPNPLSSLDLQVL